MGSFLKKNVMEICIATAPLEVQRFDQIVEKLGFTWCVDKQGPLISLLLPVLFFCWVLAVFIWEWVSI
jgi:hypothetical protein